MFIAALSARVKKKKKKDLKKNKIPRNKLNQESKRPIL